MSVPVSAELLATGLGALLTAVLASLGPTVIARLPEPALDLDAAGKVPYRDIAATSALRTQLAACGAILGAGIGWRLGLEPLMVVWIFLCAVGLVLAYVDARTRLLPTRIIAPSYMIVVALVTAAAAIDQDAQLLKRAVVGWAIMGGLYLLMWLVFPRGLGYGDVRLSGLLGIALGAVGWGTLGAGLYAGFLLGGVGGLALMLKGGSSRRSLPFGPYMLAGAALAVMWGEPVAHWYTSF